MGHYVFRSLCPFVNVSFVNVGFFLDTSDQVTLVHMFSMIYDLSNLNAKLEFKPELHTPQNIKKNSASRSCVFYGHIHVYESYTLY